MLKDIDTDFIHINFFNEWTYVHPTLIRIYPFKFKNIPSGSFIKCLIKDEKGNDGIALVPSKIVKKINDGSLWSINAPNICTFRIVKSVDSKKKLLRGGKPLVNPLYKEQFIEWYTNKKRDKVNAYEIFNELLSYNLIEEELSILVGATNMYDDMHYNDYDYYRFKNSTVYNLYIDRVDSTNIERQYDMYTIGYQNIFSNMGLYLVGRVWQIHFDISVAYFCPIDYLKLAENILIPGCKIVFDLAQHMGMVCIFNRELNIFYLGRHAMTKEEIENRYNVVINVDKQVITPRITNGIYGSGHLSPQIGLNIFDSRTNKPFKRDLYRGYIDYCREKYPRLSFAEKTYSYANYSYPVPIKTINQEIDSYNSIFNFIANNVMTLSERIDYIRNKRLSDSQINEFINRVLSRTRLFNNFCQETDTDHTRPNIDQYITGRINYEIKLNNEYIEGTKI